MVMFEIRFQKKYNSFCPKTQLYPFITPQYIRIQKFTFPDFWNICEIKIPRDLQLGIPRGTQGTNSLRFLAVFQPPFPGEKNLAPSTCPPSPGLFPEFPRKGTIFSILFIFKNILQKNAWSTLYLVVFNTIFLNSLLFCHF